MIDVTATPLATLAGLADMADGTLEIAGRDPATPIGGVSIDSRTLAPGDLFVPLPGARTDGHAFLAEAFRRGAAAALCARAAHAGMAEAPEGPLVLVDDVTAALQRVGRRHRARWSGALIAVTGSSGKTTTKDLIARALETAGPVLRTEGNRNNHWGVPLTLLGLRAEHRAAVVELGTNHPGEIASLAGLASPTAAVITNAGSAHIEYFGSVEAIAREKASLAHVLPAEATAFVGPGDTLRDALAGARCHIVTFGPGAEADVHPTRVEDLGPDGSRIEVAGFPPFRIALVGAHQVSNALAALAVAGAMALDPAAVARALEGYAGMAGRMEVRAVRGAHLIVDCYNANPESTRAALETLASWSGVVRRIAVLGDMLELGADASRLHRETGAAVRAAELWTTGIHAADYADGARRAGVPVRTFDSKPALAAALREALGPGAVALIKASRGAALEQVLEGLEG